MMIFTTLLVISRYYSLFIPIIYFHFIFIPRLFICLFIYLLDWLILYGPLLLASLCIYFPLQMDLSFLCYFRGSDFNIRIRFFQMPGIFT